MKERFKSIGATILIIVILFGISFVRMAWQEYKEKTKENEFKPILEKYYSQKYSQPIVISNIDYINKNKEFYCSSFLKNNEKIRFNTDAKVNSKTSNYSFTDIFFIHNWEEEVQKEIKDYITSFYNNIFSIEFKIYGKPAPEENMMQYTFEGADYFLDFVNKAEIPTYAKMKDNIQIKGYIKEIKICINGDINKSNRNNEYQKVYQVCKFIIEKGYNPNNFSISYGEGSRNGSGFSTGSGRIFSFTEFQLKKINSVADIEEHGKEFLEKFMK